MSKFTMSVDMDGAAFDGSVDDAGLELLRIMGKASGRVRDGESDTPASTERGLCAPLPPSVAREHRQVPSPATGDCGHPLDGWEAHVQHHPECSRELCLDVTCTCPEVCADCCVACGYDLAERAAT